MELNETALNINDPERMRSNPFCDASMVDNLWQQKSRLDKLYDANEGTFSVLLNLIHLKSAG